MALTCVGAVAAAVEAQEKVAVVLPEPVAVSELPVGRNRGSPGHSHTRHPERLVRRPGRCRFGRTGRDLRRAWAVKEAAAAVKVDRAKEVAAVDAGREAGMVAMADVASHSYSSSLMVFQSQVNQPTRGQARYAHRRNVAL